MNADIMLKNVCELRALLNKWGLPQAVVYMPTEPPNRRQAINHMTWMLNRMEEWLRDQMNINQEIWDQIVRWHGFIQGVAWSYGWVTLKDTAS